MAISLHNVRSPGRATLPFEAPVFRSKDLSALPLAAPGPATPIDDMSFEHAHRVPELSSARTPRIDRLSLAPGLIQGSAAAAPGGRPEDSTLGEAADEKCP